MGMSTVVGLTLMAFTQATLGLFKGLAFSGERFVLFLCHREFIFSSSVFCKRRRAFATKLIAFRTISHALPRLELCRTVAWGYHKS